MRRTSIKPMSTVSNPVKEMKATGGTNRANRRNRIAIRSTSAPTSVPFTATETGH